MHKAYYFQNYISVFAINNILKSGIVFYKYFVAHRRKVTFVIISASKV